MNMGRIDFGRIYENGLDFAQILSKETHVRLLWSFSHEKNLKGRLQHTVWGHCYFF